MSKTLTINLNDGTRVFCDNGMWSTYTYNKDWFIVLNGNAIVGVYHTIDVFSVSVESYEMITFDNKLSWKNMEE
jgi:hypothetical protein